MEGKYLGIAQAILRAASDGGLQPDHVVNIVANETGANINCYPGIQSHECYPLAVFVALHGKLRRGGRWPYDFEGILQAMVQHVQGSCPDVTKDVVLITDSWWAPNFEKWQGNIETMKKNGINVEAYLIGYPNVHSQVKIQ